MAGDWTGALNVFTTDETEENKTKCLEEGKKTEAGLEIPVQVMLDGPYGGCSISLGQYENVLLFAGGSGATFTIGLLDDIVGRCVKLGRPRGERTKRIEFVWCIRSFRRSPFIFSLSMSHHIFRLDRLVRAYANGYHQRRCADAGRARLDIRYVSV